MGAASERPASVIQLASRPASVIPAEAKLPICIKEPSHVVRVLDPQGNTAMPAAAVAPHPVEPKEPGRGSASKPAGQSQYSMSRSAFWLMLRRIAVIAAFADVMFLVLFLALGLP